jgi:hypothetical protein
LAITGREVLVRDIMQKVAEWHVAYIEQVERVSVAAVANMFAETRLTHLPVMAKPASSVCAACCRRRR